MIFNSALNEVRSPCFIHPNNALKSMAAFRRIIRLRQIIPWIIQVRQLICLILRLERSWFRMQWTIRLNLFIRFSVNLTDFED